MVVEDDPDALWITRTVLEQEGALVTGAVNGLEALKRLVTAHPDVVLCDLRMPRMDGIELVERLRADPHWMHLPVVAVTAFGSAADYQGTLHAGFDAHLVKPVDPATLVAVVLRVRRADRPRPRRTGRRPPSAP